MPLLFRGKNNNVVYLENYKWEIIVTRFRELGLQEIVELRDGLPRQCGKEERGHRDTGMW